MPLKFTLQLNTDGCLPMNLGSHCCHVMNIGHYKLLKWTENIEVEYESISSTQWYQCQICMLIQCDTIMGSQISLKYLQQTVHRWPVRAGHDIDALVLERRNSIANAVELRLSCTNPTVWDVFCVFRVWCMSCLSHCSVVFKIVFYWMDIFILWLLN